MPSDYWKAKAAGANANYLFAVKQAAAQGKPIPKPSTTLLRMNDVANGTMDAATARNDFNQRRAMQNTVRFAHFRRGQVPQAPDGYRWMRDFGGEVKGDLLPYKLVRMHQSTNPFG